MIIQKKKLVACFGFGMALIVGTVANANTTTAPSSDKLLDRPTWLPVLPKINTRGFAPDSTVYVELRKRILEKKDKKDVEELYKLAQKNHLPSIVMMGYIYDNNLGVVEVNPATAAKYWAVGAKAGDTASLYNLGILYMNGRGVPRNIDTAEKLFLIASQKGMLIANYALGQIYEKKVQYTTAISHYQKCVPAKSLTSCKTRYGILNITRIKLRPDQAKKIVNLLAQASREGDLEATYTLARLAAEGIVLNQSYPTMVYYLEAMVKYPNSTPYYKNLALKMYNAYNPSEPDIKKGKDNFRIANAGGVSIAGSFRPIDLTKTVLDAGNIFE